jgi:MFS family permease
MSNQKIRPKTLNHRALAMLALILAGEAIFLLPFVLVRVFRPTVLEVFNITNYELGLAQAVYGVVAMIAYFFGGPLADRFPARKLMSIALVATALGGFYISKFPALNELKFLYGFWGATTILIFWAAMIKATREWGGKKLQGSAFGLLEGGRGLSAAIIGSIAVAVFAAILPVDVVSASLTEQKEAYKYVLIAVSIFIIIVAVFVWLVLPKEEVNSTESSTKFTSKGVLKIIKMPTVWLQAIIIACGYVAYKATDDFSLMAQDVLNYNKVESASVGAMALYMRPIVAILAGIIADKLSASKMIIISFLLMMIGGLTIGTGVFNISIPWFFMTIIITTSIGIFALRGLYFAIMEEGKIPLAFTGTAVGLFSVIGYTPDIFMGLLMGYLLDRSPGILGHQHVFLVIAAFSLIGMLSAIIFRKITRKTIVN